jgi:predicted Zn-dependent protease
VLGYCFTTNVLAGEWFRQNGDDRSAEGEFREITEQQPDNPWGWYLLGELYSAMGRRGQARDCFRRVVGLVPKHGPSRAALAALGGAKKSGA